MNIVSIKHDKEEFQHNLSLHLGDPDHGGIMAAVDVITRDGLPQELMLVVRSANIMESVWYCDECLYSDYESAFRGLGKYLDSINPDHAPLSDGWVR